MKLPIVIELAGIPVGKGRPRFVRATGRAYTPTKTRNYESDLRLAGKLVMRNRPPVEGALAVEVIAYFPVPESWPKKKKQAALAGEIRPTVKPDGDNLLKVLDALNEVAFQDDKQVVDASISKHYSAQPMLRIIINNAKNGSPDHVNDQKRVAVD